MIKTVFLDRDGTIIRDEEYLADPDGVFPLPGAVESLLKLRDAGYALIIVTNQSGVGRGMFTVNEMKSVNSRMLSLFAEYGVFFDDILICPHAPDEKCDCRKPSPKLLLEAAERLGIDLSASAMIGDKPSDPKTGIAAGCRHNILITLHPAEFADSPYQTANDIAKATDLILSEQTPTSH